MMIPITATTATALVAVVIVVAEGFAEVVQLVVGLVPVLLVEVSEGAHMLAVVVDSAETDTPA